LVSNKSHSLGERFFFYQRAFTENTSMYVFTIPFLQRNMKESRGVESMGETANGGKRER
jgi:hypothetical protein